MGRQKLFSVTSEDCRFQAKRGSGKGGQARNKTSNAIQCFHDASGAMGECENGRSQELNKREAFRLMTQTKEFQGWMNLKIEASMDRVEITEANDQGDKFTRKLRGDEV